MTATATNSGITPVAVPAVSREIIRTLRVSPSDLRSVPVADSPESHYLAILAQPGLASQQYVSARADNGWPAEQIVLEYDSAEGHFERRWVASDRFEAAGLASPIHYQLESDTSSTGYISE